MVFNFLECFQHFLYFGSEHSAIYQSPRLSHYILSLSLGYLIGSFPTAYVMLKWNARLDIRKSGSGNVGAMNAFDVSGSKLLGITVMVIDMLKGIVAVGVCSLVIGNDIGLVSTCGLGSIIGHDYPVWLKFKGGRGLSTSAGLMLVLGWIFVAIWCAIWGICFGLSKHIHISNIIATILSPMALWIVPQQWIENTLPTFMLYQFFFYLSIAICILILLRHIDSMKTLWNSYTQQSLS